MSATPCDPPLPVGIDIGGTKISACTLTADGEIDQEHREATPDDYPSLREALVRIGRTLAGGRPFTLGVGVPGVSRDDGNDIQAINVPALTDQPLRDDLSQALGCRVMVENDATCFALSEARGGAAAGARVAFCVTLGTGIGAGLLIGGRLFRGATGAAGEWGHNSLPGREGTIERHLAGPGFERAYREAGGEALSATDIADRAAAGDGLALAVFTRYANDLIAVLANLCNLLDPDVIVLGGSLSRMTGLTERIARDLPGACYNEKIDIAVRTARFGPDGGRRGAALLGADPAGALG